MGIGKDTFESTVKGAGNALGGSIVGIGMGMLNKLFNKSNDQKQLDQQQKLTDMQYDANLGLMKESYKQQKEMWDSTNYEAQRKHLEAAGLNPALMYGQGGGGGSTTGSGTASVSGGQASDETSRIQAQTQQMGMGLQLAKLKSEIDLNEATANKLNTDADVQSNEGRGKLKADTALATASVNEITEKINNLKADTELKGEQTQLNKLQQNATAISNSFNSDNNSTLLKQNIQILKELTAKANVAESTQQSLIDTAKQNVRLMASQTMLNNSSIKLQESERNLISSKIEEIINSISISNKQIVINQATLEQALTIKEMELSNGQLAKEWRGLALRLKESLTGEVEFK